MKQKFLQALDMLRQQAAEQLEDVLESFGAPATKRFRSNESQEVIEEELKRLIEMRGTAVGKTEETEDTVRVPKANQDARERAEMAMTRDDYRRTVDRVTDSLRGIDQHQIVVLGRDVEGSKTMRLAKCPRHQCSNQAAEAKPTGEPGTEESTGGPGSRFVRGELAVAAEEGLDTESKVELEDKEMIIARLRKEKDRMKKLRDELGIFERDIDETIRLVTTDAEGMEEISKMSGPERRKKWRLERDPEGKESSEALNLDELVSGAEEEKKESKPGVARKTCAGGVRKIVTCGRKCKTHAGEARCELHTAERTAPRVSDPRRVEDLSWVELKEVKNFIDEQRKKGIVASRENSDEIIAAAREEMWQKNLQCRAQKVTVAATEVEPKPKIVRGARAYLPTHR
jgi:hypothetical protein